ncbi:Uncharacterized [Moorella glycerini]|uniref:Uncharacterized protein n=1 Tax=Neomoorella stamsii TaxID=1266720 RepID=A0A9X7J2X0_9FIRM|nr:MULTISPECIES: hypothetical protein [Moorella]PRR72946.1 hypothetical protein MOST_14910 [Moorella stamsii]CEP67617.1 Uncharacterized [Moorella glycerini]
MNGSYHKTKRALEIDLEEIRLLAEAAAATPSFGVRHTLLNHILGEVEEAMFWNHHLAHLMVYEPPYQPPYPPPYKPPRPPYYDDPVPYSEKPAEE